MGLTERRPDSSREEDLRQKPKPKAAIQRCSRSRGAGEKRMQGCRQRAMDPQRNGKQTQHHDLCSWAKCFGPVVAVNGLQERRGGGRSQRKRLCTLRSCIHSAQCIHTAFDAYAQRPHVLSARCCWIRNSCSVDQHAVWCAGPAHKDCFTVLPRTLPYLARHSKTTHRGTHARALELTSRAWHAPKHSSKTRTGHQVKYTIHGDSKQHAEVRVVM